MLTENLFEKVLIEPYEQRAVLYIISGYASATMASRHFKRLIGNKRRTSFIRRRGVRIELIVGMAVQDGVSKQDHEGFQELTRAYNDLFICRYVTYEIPVHSKAFAWYDSDGSPIIGFVGSANYTQSAFSSNRREVITEDNADAIRSYFELVKQNTIDCLDPQVNDIINIYAGRRRDEVSLEEDTSEISNNFDGLPHIKISFLDRQGDLPQRSGLNWGQRREQRREPNQAYIRLPATVYQTDFFPPRGQHFTIITDDGITLLCVRAQDNSKAIHTPDNNSRMGEYFRNRLNVLSGKSVLIEDLERYGRSDVDFYKIDEETFYMDFSN